VDESGRTRQDRLREVMVRHLIAHAKTPPVCPICSSSEWTVEPVVMEQMVTVDEHGRQYPTGKAMPVIPLVCKVCFFIYQFAWAPIAQQSGNG
jgi:hypothetical protein